MYGQDILQVHPRPHDEAPFDRLPPELGSIIFTAYVSNISRKQSPFTLGAVCQRWRQIAWTTPEVWKRLEAHFVEPFPSGPGLTESRLQLMREWLSRSGKLPLSIIIHMRWSAEVDDQSYENGLRQRLYDVAEVLNQHVEQWSYLDIKMPPYVLSHLGDVAGVPSDLHYISLSREQEGPDDYITGVPFLSRIKPKVIDVSGLHFEALKFRFERLTKLSISYLPVSYLLGFFRSGDSLQDCSFEKVGEDPGYIEDTKEHGHVIHHQLKNLWLGSYELGVDELFFRQVTFSALERLSVHVRRTEGPTDSLKEFFIRSSCKLKYLSIVDYGGDRLANLTRLQPSLEVLDIQSVGEGRSLQPFFAALSSHLDPEAADDATPLLPSLKRFSNNGLGIFPWRYLVVLLGPLSRWTPDAILWGRPLSNIVITSRIANGEEIKPLSDLVARRLERFSGQLEFRFVLEESQDPVPIRFSLSLDQMKKPPEPGPFHQLLSFFNLDT